MKSSADKETREDLGFSSDSSPPSHATASLPGVATGNWGCGVFGGDVEFKCLIQWAAASLCGRDIRYHPFTSYVGADLPAVVRAVRSSSQNTVGGLCVLLSRYAEGHRQGPHSKMMHPDLNYNGAGIDNRTARHESFFEFVLRNVAPPMPPRCALQ